MAINKTRLTYNDIVAILPELAPIEQLNLLEVLSSFLKKTLNTEVERHTLLELEGLGASTWSKVNVDDYIRQERDSWN